MGLNGDLMVIEWWFNSDSMGLNGDLMGLNGDLMGLNGDLMGLNGGSIVIQWD